MTSPLYNCWCRWCLPTSACSPSVQGTLLDNHRQACHILCTSRLGCAPYQRHPLCKDILSHVDTDCLCQNLKTSVWKLTVSLHPLFTPDFKPENALVLSKNVSHRSRASDQQNICDYSKAFLCAKNGGGWAIYMEWICSLKCWKRYILYPQVASSYRYSAHNTRYSSAPPCKYPLARP